MAKLSAREQWAQQTGKPKEQYKSSGKSDNSGVGKTSLEKMNGFNPSYFGTAFQEAYNQADGGTKAAINVLGATMISQAQANEQIPVALTSKDIKDLWKKAENDKTINKFYADDLKLGTDTLNKNLDLLSSDYQNLTEKEKQQYVDAKKQLDETQAAAGTAYSGFRGQAKGKLEKEQKSIVESAQNPLKSQLNTLESAYEQRYGSKALAGLKLPGIGAGDAPTIGGDYTGAAFTPVSYTPTGGIAGTAKTSELADVESQFKELEQEKLQQRGL